MAEPIIKPNRILDLDQVTITESQITDLDHDDPEAIHDNVAGEIAAVTEKVSPVGGDLLLIEDSEAGNAKKRLQVGNISIGDSFMEWAGL